MADSYDFTITKTYHYYGYPQAQYHYLVKGQWFTAEIRLYGNQGYDFPKVNCDKKCNGYFWSLNLFMRHFYAHKLDKVFRSLGTNESTTITLSYDD